MTPLYLWLHIILKVIEDISWWSISSYDNNLPIGTLGLAYSQFL